MVYESGSINVCGRIFRQDFGNMQYDNEEFYKQIEDEYDVALRRNVKKSWEDYWAWLVEYN